MHFFTKGKNEVRGRRRGAAPLARPLLGATRTDLPRRWHCPHSG